MYDNTTLRITEGIYLNPAIHKRELSRKLKLTMPSIDNSLKKIKDIVKMEKKGNQFQYFLDYSKDNLTPVLYSIENLRFSKLPAKIRIAIKDFLQELEEKPIISAVFGSYARGDYNENSDIDVLLVFQRLGNPKDIENTAKKINMRTNAKISPVYLNYKEFKESFHNSSKDFFKKIKKDALLINGMEYWRQLKNEEA